VRRRGGKERYARLGDEDLISLVGSGDARAFAAFYDRHSRAAYGMAILLDERAAAAEDLAQDAPQGVALGGGLQARARQRAELGPLHRPQPRHRPAPLARQPPQDPGTASSSPRPDPSPARPSPRPGAATGGSGWARPSAPCPRAARDHNARPPTRAHPPEISRRLGLPLGTVKGRMRLGLKKLGGRRNLEELTATDIAPPSVCGSGRSRSTGDSHPRHASAFPSSMPILPLFTESVEGAFHNFDRKGFLGQFASQAPKQHQRYAIGGIRRCPRLPDT
jgi:RNA polymerase sigma-70 factor (ECF subfamily)